MKSKIFCSGTILLMSFSCGTNQKISDYVTQEKFNYEYKKEMIYKCINVKANELLKQEIDLESTTSPHFYPPPPFYIKQFSTQQDSIIRTLSFSDRILFNCLNSFDNKEIDRLIIKEYEKVVVSPPVEGSDE
jgi:signal peptidase I